MSQSRHIVFNVPDISCNHCKAAIEEALSGIDGVETAEVDVASKTVDVRIDPGRTSNEAVAAAIAAGGYAVAGEHTFGE